MLDAVYQSFHKDITTLRRAKCWHCETKYLIDDINGFLKTSVITNGWRTSAYGYFSNYQWVWYSSPCCKTLMLRTKFILGESFKQLIP